MKQKNPTGILTSGAPRCLAPGEESWTAPSMRQGVLSCRDVTPRPSSRVETGPTCPSLHEWFSDRDHFGPRDYG